MIRVAESFTYSDLPQVRTLLSAKASDPAGLLGGMRWLQAQVAAEARKPISA